MILAKKNGLFKKIFGVYLSSLLKKHFYRIHLCGENNISPVTNEIPAIFFANHSNWWDGFIAYFLSSKRWRLDDYLMMDIEQMKKYSFFKYLGVFSVDRSNPREAIKSIEYAAPLLKDTGRVLWMFPQGGIQAQDLRPIDFYSGITNLAEKIGTVKLQPVAIRYEFILEQRPEIFIRIGEADIIKDKNVLNKDFKSYLRDKLVKELDILKEDVIKNNLGGYDTVFEGKESRNKTIDKITA